AAVKGRSAEEGGSCRRGRGDRFGAGQRCRRCRAGLVGWFVGARSVCRAVDRGLVQQAIECPGVVTGVEPPDPVGRLVAGNDAEPRPGVDGTGLGALGLVAGGAAAQEPEVAGAEDRRALTAWEV